MKNETIFCPNCGKADQLPESYCRQCGNYLPDFNKISKKVTTPEQHIIANTVLNLLTAVVSVFLAIFLYSFFLGREDTPVIIYLTGGFLIAITAWQIQIFWRNLLLRKHFKNQNAETAKQTVYPEPQKSFESVKTKELLKEPDLSDSVPASVTETTTRKLKIKR